MIHFTQAQQDAAAKIMDLMREHFEAGVCALLSETADEPERSHSTDIFWHGGAIQAMGLVECARIKFELLEADNQGSAELEEEEEE